MTTLSILSEHIPTQSNTLPGDDLVHNASINTNQILSDQQRVIDTTRPDRPTVANGRNFQTDLNLITFTNRPTALLWFRADIS